MQARYKRPLTVAVVAGVVGIATLAAFVVVRGSSSTSGAEPPTDEGSSSGEQTSVASMSRWQGTHRWVVPLERVDGARWERGRDSRRGNYALGARVEVQGAEKGRGGSPPPRKFLETAGSCPQGRYGFRTTVTVRPNWSTSSGSTPGIPKSPAVPVSVGVVQVI